MLVVEKQDFDIASRLLRSPTNGAVAAKSGALSLSMQMLEPVAVEGQGNSSVSSVSGGSTEIASSAASPKVFIGSYQESDYTEIVREFGVEFAGRLKTDATNAQLQFAEATANKQLEEAQHKRNSGEAGFNGALAGACVAIALSVVTMAVSVGLPFMSKAGTPKVPKEPAVPEPPQPTSGVAKSAESPAVVSAGPNKTVPEANIDEVSPPTSTPTEARQSLADNTPPEQMPQVSTAPDPSANNASAGGPGAPGGAPVGDVDVAAAGAATQQKAAMLPALSMTLSSVTQAGSSLASAPGQLEAKLEEADGNVKASDAERNRAQGALAEKIKSDAAGTGDAGTKAISELNAIPAQEMGSYVKV